VNVTNKLVDNSEDQIARNKLTARADRYLTVTYICKHSDRSSEQR